MSAAVPAVAKPLKQQCQEARAQHRAGSGAVLDVLLRAQPDATELAAALWAEEGVRVWADEPGWQASFERWEAALARQHHAVVLVCAGQASRLAMEDPWDEPLQQRVAALLGQWPEVVAVTRAQMTAWLEPTGSELLTTAQGPEVTGPVVSFVDDALVQGFKGGASDVHFECDRQGVTVKLRLDGVMVPHAHMEGQRRAQEVISRIKVLAALDITERRVPQDGRFRLQVGGVMVDLRVSIMPSVHGEDAVLRLLDKSQLRGQEASVSLASLAFAPAAADAVRHLAALPSGMLLVTGPTGSGKTTTVYAALSEINTGLEKIITIEDPVEYELPGVLQIPVNERKGLTFAKGLRSILRHDPDRILVGEIRDAETAEIAVQSALTGHLVFTTVHANSMGDVVGRFRHFGIDMFGFMSALNGVVVQRLLRRLCPVCQAWAAPEAAEQRWAAAWGVDLPQVPVAVGCPECRQTGYKGRFVVAEVHAVEDALRDLVTTLAPLSSLKQHAVAAGVVSLQNQSARCVAEGRTTVAEVRRVIGLAA